MSVSLLVAIAGLTGVGVYMIPARSLSRIILGFSLLGHAAVLALLAAGGPAGGFGAVIPPWLGTRSHAVTLPVGACVDCEP